MLKKMTVRNVLICAIIIFAADIALGVLLNNTYLSAAATSHNSRTHVIGDTTYERFFDDQDNLVRQIATSHEGDTKVVRTSNGQGQTTEIRRISETPDATDSTTINREVVTKRYPVGSRLPYETVVLIEQEVLLSLAERAPRNRSITTKVYSKTKPRRLLETIVEEGRLLHIDEAGVPIYEGKRTTTTPDGVVEEVLDPDTQRWKQVESEPSDDADSDTSGSAQQCEGAEESLSKLFAEQLELRDLQDELKRETDELEANIERAKAWQGLPKRFELVRRFPDDPEKTYLECPVCEGPEESIVNSLHAFACIEGGNRVFHPEPLPSDVEAYRYVFELKAKSKRQTLLDATGFCGKGISPMGLIAYTEWALRDDYLETMEPALERRVSELAALDEQLAAASERVNRAREDHKTNCEKQDRTIPALLGPARPQSDNADPECVGSGIIGGVECVDEMMGN